MGITSRAAGVCGWGVRVQRGRAEALSPAAIVGEDAAE
jgi:hypothetical protein